MYSLKETRVIQVPNSPAYIDAVSERAGLFFWNVQSVQITHSQDSHLENWGYLGTWSVTETTNYATITLEREKTLPGYSRIVELEARYEALENRALEAASAKLYSPKPFLIVFCISAFIFLFSLIMMKFIRWTDLAIHCPGRRPPRAFRLGTGISERLSLAGRGAL